MARTLYLIDGFAQIFRAYYAIRGGMRSPVTSEPTHAVFGFTSMLIKLLGQLRAEHVVVALDSPGDTFRDELFAEYKGTRRATPDDLISQIPRIMELIQLFGIPMIAQPGLEADDVIATVTRTVLNDPANQDMEIRIVSKDKDLEQLLGDRVAMFDVQTDTTVDVAALWQNKGITPAQVVDVLALTGDTVDNVPGVEGIGIKTAAQLVQQFGSLDNILANLDQIKGKRRENIEKAMTHLPLSKTLVTLKDDADLPFTVETAQVRPIELGRIIHFFQQLGFHRYQDEVRRLVEGRGQAAEQGTAARPANGQLGLWPDAGASAEVRLATTVEVGGVDLGAPAVASSGDAPSGGGTGTLSAAVEVAADGTAGAGSAVAVSVTVAPPETASSGSYEAVLTVDQLNALVAKLQRQPLIAVDTETTGLERSAKLCGLSFAWKPGHGVYVPVRSPQPELHLGEQTVIAALRPLLEDEAIGKCGHNVKFDAAVLSRCGVRLRGIVFDSMLASLLLDASQQAHKLDTMALSQLNYQMIPITDLIGEGTAQVTMADVPLEQVVPYAAEDADIALRLARRLGPMLEQAGMSRLMQEVEAPLAAVLAEMEGNGIVCDPEELFRQGAALGERVAELRRQVHEAAGCEFHVDSPKQLAEVLFDKLGLTPGKRTKTGRSTDIQVLEKLASQENRDNPKTSVPRLVIEYRQLAKLISTYLGNLRDSVDPTTGRIHTTFHQLVTATGRLASQAPNLQNIPVRSDVGRQIRKAFHAPDGHVLICADYSQVELRILAHLSQDPALLDAFANDRDIHAAVASQVFEVPLEEVTREQRAHAKMINFGIIYGITPFGLARRVEGLDVAGATRLIDGYKQRFPGIDGFLQECIRQALDLGYVCTMLGRRRAIPEITASHFSVRNLGERLAINTVVQGSAADLIKIAMVNVQRRIERDNLPLKMLLQIHDELVMEAPAERADEFAGIVRGEMERAMELRVPLRAEAGIGKDWMSAK